LKANIKKKGLRTLEMNFSRLKINPSALSTTSLDLPIAKYLPSIHLLIGCDGCLAVSKQVSVKTNIYTPCICHCIHAIPVLHSGT